jgi:hypothetical protein
MNSQTPPLPPPQLSAFTWRPARSEDIPAIQKMLADNQEIDRNESVPSRERLQGILGMLGDQLETNTLWLWLRMEASPHRQ